MSCSRFAIASQRPGCSETSPASTWHPARVHAADEPVAPAEADEAQRRTSAARHRRRCCAESIGVVWNVERCSRRAKHQIWLQGGINIGCMRNCGPVENLTGRNDVLITSLLKTWALPMRRQWHHRRDGQLYSGETTGGLWPSGADRFSPANGRCTSGCRPSGSDRGAVRPR